uniref:P-type Cu(+) transporter n=1 Tax=Eutreptiella gymnastica TaxID=73025 RepID=A0A7S1NU91_9EUGL
MSPRVTITSARPTPVLDNALYTMIERKDLALFHEMGGVKCLSEKFNTADSAGLSSSQVTKNRSDYGENVLPDTERATFLGLIWEALKDLMMRLLIVAAIISIVFGMTLEDPKTGRVEREEGWIEGTAILISVALVVLVTATNDYSKAKKFQEMEAVQSKKDVEVIRDDAKVSIDVSELVVGDMLHVAAGMQMPADAIYIHGQDIKSDESAVTGESDIMKKNSDKDPFFISGTNITEGDGVVLIIGVGVNSFAGKLSMATRGVSPQTPLQVKLDRLAGMIGKGGMVAALLTFLVLSIKEVIKIATVEGHVATPTAFLEYVMVSITLIVVAIPEGLPLAVTIALAYSMKSMMKDNCLVRVLAACETMGGTNAICSDKTGTLTTNQMTVVQGWLAGDNFVFTGYGVTGGENAAATAQGEKVEMHSSEDNVKLLCAALSHNTACEELVGDDGQKVWVGGNKTEHGLLGLVNRIGQDYKAIRNSVKAADKRSYPFSSAKKRMTSILCMGNTWRVYVKGASEWILEDCTQALSRTGVEPVDAAYKAKMMAIIEQMADQGNRTIGVAYVDVPANGSNFPEEEPNYQYTLIGVMGIQDPIRPEVPTAVDNCNRAGISVRMVTGDNKNTAMAIAKKCGILSPNTEPEEGTVMEGPAFRELATTDPEKLERLIPKLKVLARSSPTDKLLLVSCIMDQGDIVAVTGDGTNDAPALKLADAGFAMRTGTDVATGAADMVLMDDNFATVVRAAAWGRTVNENIRKFLQFQLTVNVAGVLLTLIGSAVNEHNEEPLKPVQLLWLNLIMDTFAALALATEWPADDCLTRPGSRPIRRAAPLISRRMWSFILGHAAWQLIGIFIVIFFAPTIFQTGPCTLEDVKHLATMDENGNCVNGAVHSTCIFNTFIWFQLFNEFNARKLYSEKNPFGGLWRSRAFLAIFLLCVGFQFVAVQFFGPFMHTTPINPQQWGICIAFGATELLIGFLIKCLPITDWEPAADGSDNRKGLDKVKKELILEAKVNAGMIKSTSVEVGLKTA